jgi:hypothetical protein
MIRKSGFSEKIMPRQKRVEQIAVAGACSSEIGGNSRGVSTQRRGDTRCLLSRLRRFLRRSAAARFLRSPRNSVVSSSRSSIASSRRASSGIRASKRAPLRVASRSNPPLSSLRKQGPITTGRNDRGRQLTVCQNVRACMGPGAGKRLAGTTMELFLHQRAMGMKVLESLHPTLRISKLLQPSILTCRNNTSPRAR